MLASAFILLSACHDPQADALKELTKRGYSLSVAEFFRAAKAEDVEALQWFAKAGLQPNVTDAQGRTAVDEVVKAGKAKALKTLLASGAKIHSEPAKTGRLLVEGIGSHRVEVVQALIEAGLKPGTSEGELALVVAAREGQREMVDLLVPLCGGQVEPALVAAARSGDVGVISRLLQAGASVFHREPESLMTPLMIAVAEGHAQAAEILLASGADRLALDAKGRHALDLAQEKKLSPLITLLSAEPTADERRVPLSVNGFRQELGSTTKIQPGSQVTFVGVQEATLPLRLDDADATSASVRDGDQVVKLATDEPVPGTEWLLEKALPTGLFFQPCAVLRMRGSAERVMLVKGLPVRHGKLRAWLRIIGDNEAREAADGDVFELAGEQVLKLRVSSVTPMRVTLTDDATKQSWELKPGGMR